MQGTWVPPLVQEDPTYCGATKLMCQNYWACMLHGAHVPQQQGPHAENTEASVS